MTNSISNPNTLAISTLEDEIRSLNSQIESSYNKSSEMIHNTLPQGASWNVSEDDLYDERSKMKDNIELLKIFINALSGSEIYTNINDVDLELSPSTVIELLENEVKYINGQISSSYNLEESVRSNDLPNNASWDISVDSISEGREKYEQNIDSLEKSIELLKSIKSSTIESFKGWFNGSTPKFNEELNIGKEKSKIVFVGYCEFLFVNIDW